MSNQPLVAVEMPVEEVGISTTESTDRGTAGLWKSVAHLNKSRIDCFSRRVVHLSNGYIPTHTGRPEIPKLGCPVTDGFGFASDLSNARRLTPPYSGNHPFLQSSTRVLQTDLNASPASRKTTVSFVKMRS